MASGPALYVVRVEHRVSSLQLLCQQAIASALREDKDVSKLTLPPRLCSYLSTAFIPTIKVKRPPPASSSSSPLTLPARPQRTAGRRGGVREMGESLQAEHQSGSAQSAPWSSLMRYTPCVRVQGGLVLGDGCEPLVAMVASQA